MYLPKHMTKNMLIIRILLVKVEKDFRNICTITYIYTIYTMYIHIREFPAHISSIYSIVIKKYIYNNDACVRNPECNCIALFACTCVCAEIYLYYMMTYYR